MTDLNSASALQHDDAEIRRKRLLFRCWHRGTQEIDLIFGRFAENSLTGLSTAQLGRLEALLDCTDAQLFDWVTGRCMPPAYDHDVMHMLRSSQCQLKKG
jgi:antitoxin CptB